MNRTTLVRWSLATAVFLAIGWAMQRYGLNAARLALLALLILVYFFGGYGRQPRAGVAADAIEAVEAGAGTPADPTGVAPAPGQAPDGP